MVAAVPERAKDKLELKPGKKIMGYVSGRQKKKGSTATDCIAKDDIDEIHRIMTEV